jgi:hypothetical protein
MKIVFQLLISIFVLGFYSCLSDSEEELLTDIDACDTLQVTYSANIEPILATNCYSCHRTGIARGQVVLDNYASIKVYAQTGQLSGAIEHKPGFSPMPQDAGKLSDCEIAKVRAWIALGLPE